ncbi:MAG: phosphoglucosamine mutase [Desulfobacteraceae bacterium]
MGRLFGTDGIRGRANHPPVDVHTAVDLGRAVVERCRRQRAPARVVLGRDTRLSGEMLESAVAAGAASMGGEVLRAGLVPTPGVAFLTKDLGAGAGIVISASHNPYQDNGFKVFSAEGYKLSDEEEEDLERIMSNTDPPSALPLNGEIGPLKKVEDAVARYSTFVSKGFDSGFFAEGMRIVLDTANGATFRAAPEAFAYTGARVEVLHDRPDGRNINLGCGSEDTSRLQERVRETGAQVGLAFDGDGDRLIAVDERGVRLTGDQILMIIASDMKERGELAKDILVTTVMSNLGLREACSGLGITHYAAGVGDRQVLREMQRLGAVLGGEESGHIILLDRHTTGDGILSGLRLISCMLRQGRPLSELACAMTVFPQELVNVEVRRKPPLEGIPEVQEVISEVESELGPRGRVLVRYSGTQSLCRIMVEGPSEEQSRKACGRIAAVLMETLR